jgi:hypothetical protein
MDMHLWAETRRLYFVSRMKKKEIARELSVSVKTVRRAFSLSEDGRPPQVPSEVLSLLRRGHLKGIWKRSSLRKLPQNRNGPSVRGWGRPSSLS